MARGHKQQCLLACGISEMWWPGQVWKDPPLGHQPQTEAHQADTGLTHKLHGAPHNFLQGGYSQGVSLTVMFDVSPAKQCGSVLALCPISPRGGG